MTPTTRPPGPGAPVRREPATRDAVPPPRHAGGPYRISCVCWGNICRSPMAEVLLRARLADAGLGTQVVVDSAGTSDEELGRPAYPGTRRVLHAHGLSADGHRAREFAPSWIGRYDLLLAMDAGHARTLRRYAESAGTDPDRVRVVTTFARPASGAGAGAGEAAALGEHGIDDPWGRPDTAFEDVFGLLSDSFDGLVPALAALLAR